ncbi:MAG: hypothetical protein KGH79_02040 [Patescibacteria group bacterium]|nr:hypothetical protein [Patescibacteria group bacterium]
MNANKPYKIVAVGPNFVGCVPCGTLFELKDECETLQEAMAKIEKDQIYSFPSLIIGTTAEGDFSPFSRKEKVGCNDVTVDMVSHDQHIEVGGQDLFWVQDLRGSLDRATNNWPGAYMKFDPNVRVRGWRIGKIN